MQYPPSPLGSVVDTYHGTTVADPYRWLEHADDPATRRWVDAQNVLTASIVNTPRRAAIARRLTKLYDYPRVSAPLKRNGRYFYTLNEGLQNQPVLYVQEGLDGERRALIDPNALSPDGTVALTAVSPSDDGMLVAYALSRGGSDQQELYVRDVVTGNDRSDQVLWAKFTNLTWAPDASGFYYTRFPQPGTVAAGDESYFCRICFHRLGERQEDDALIFERPDDREIVLSADISTDGRWVVVTAFKGSSDNSEAYVIDRAASESTPRPVFTGFGAAFIFADAAADRLYFRTNHGAPLGRVIAVRVADLAQATAPPPPGLAPFEQVVPEQRDTLATLAVIGGRLVTVSLRHASDVIRVFELDGGESRELALPALGSLSGLSGQADDPELFIRFSSFTHPPAVFRTDVHGAALQPFGPSGLKSVDPARFEVSQVWYRSKDGTNVSMFLVHRKGLARDGDRPVLLTAYGGFNISLTPQFDPAYFVWLENDGVVAVPNLRGGGEYGEAWHQAGMFERKQNVFDDFTAAAEWLITNNYTRPERLGIEGGSNGGLLVAAVMAQRPDLFGAVVCRVPVADMLRYHLFTVGRFWISEYGSADDPAQFAYLYAYSPLHNVKDGTRYPPTLIATADTDDRVAPGMAKKLAARLQTATPHDAGPILIRVETKAGHGAGKPVAKQIDEQADIFAFLFRYLGSGIRDQGSEISSAPGERAID
jgi:prolyl oligopeptidase